MAVLRIGTSGWQYDHWRGRFYPDDLPKKRWFDYYAERFDTVEVNNTFYHLPTEKTFDAWHDAAPAGFCYVLKYSRYGTHIKRLKDPQDHLDVFVARAGRLKSYLGPILVQLPPRCGVNPKRLADFLKAAPKKMRWAVEFRDPSWLCDEIFDILREHRAALCIHDLIEDHPRVITADWIYLRYHGAGQKYGGCYSHQKLAANARQIRDWNVKGMDVYAYFNNDIEGYALRNAADLRRYCSNQ